ncbi:hypothetical protein TWF281_008084 [Arthrobotrys megalospora]
MESIFQKFCGANLVLLMVTKDCDHVTVLPVTDAFEGDIKNDALGFKDVDKVPYQMMSFIAQYIAKEVDILSQVGETITPAVAGFRICGDGGTLAIIHLLYR